MVGTLMAVVISTNGRRRKGLRGSRVRREMCLQGAARTDSDCACTQIHCDGAKGSVSGSALSACTHSCAHESYVWYALRVCTQRVGMQRSCSCLLRMRDILLLLNVCFIPIAPHSPLVALVCAPSQWSAVSMSMLRRGRQFSGEPLLPVCLVNMTVLQRCGALKRDRHIRVGVNARNAWVVLR